MAGRKDDLGLDTGDEEEAPKKEISTKKLIIIMCSMFGFMLILIVTSLIILLQDDKLSAKKTTSTEVIEQSTKSDKNDKLLTTSDNNKVEDTEDKNSEKDKVKKTKGSAVFYKINPAFVVNFLNPTKLKYLQVNVTVMARTDEAIDTVEEFLPIIKNDLIALFSRQSYEVLMSPEGKENLRKEALTVIQEILKKETGSTGIEAVLFTSFVMQ